MSQVQSGFFFSFSFLSLVALMDTCSSVSGAVNVANALSQLADNRPLKRRF